MSQASTGNEKKPITWTDIQKEIDEFAKLVCPFITVLHKPAALQVFLL